MCPQRLVVGLEDDPLRAAIEALLAHGRNAHRSRAVPHSTFSPAAHLVIDYLS
jgi:hypothetical protein